MTTEAKREYDKKRYQRIKEKRRVDYYFKKYGIRLTQRRLPLELPEIRLVRFLGIEEVRKEMEVR